MTPAAALQQKVRHLLAAQSSAPPAHLSMQLFRALGWDSNGSALNHFQNIDDGTTYNMEIDGEPTALLLVTPNQPVEFIEHKATNIAYNRGIDWLIVSDFSTTKALHARWSDDPTCLRLSATEYPTRLDILSLLSPEAFVAGRLAAHARIVEEQQPRKELRLVDEELIDRLGSWRQLLMSQSLGVTDENIHELFGRLFFIRSCEDRSILPDRPLEAILRQAADIPLVTALTALFHRLAAEFKSELFLNNEQDSPAFDPTMLLRIVRELYTPFPGLPQYKYDFSHLTVDMLGKIYEQYVSTVLVPTQPPPSLQLSFLDTSSQIHVEQRTQRREHGVFFTPSFLVNYIVQQTVERLLDTPSVVPILPRVADISCGSGAFLTRVAEQVAARFAKEDGRQQHTNGMHQILTRLMGVDIDRRAVTLARVNLWILATTREPARPLPELSTAIFDDDALTSAKLDSLKETFDVVVGNPPFRPANELNYEMQILLRRRYASAHGRFNQAYVFIERALQLVKPGGYIGLVVPNRIFGNSDARFIREIITQQCTIEQVVDFDDVPVFSEGDSYVCALILKKRVASPSIEASVPYINQDVSVQRIQELTAYPGLQLRRPELFVSMTDGESVTQTTKAPQPSGDEPWVWWASGMASRIREKVKADAVELREIARMRQGIKTGANEIFLLTRQAVDPNSGLWKMTNGLDQLVDIEPDLLRPCVKGSIIQQYALNTQKNEFDTPLYVLYPYRHGRLLKEYELEATVPVTYRYLDRYRTRLSARRSVRDGGAWYNLSRSRSAEGWIDQPKILIRLLVESPAFAFDDQGLWVPIGGTALLPIDPTIISPYLLLGVLNSALMAWYLKHAGVARYQQGYYEIAQRELVLFPFPKGPLATEPALAYRIATLAQSITRAIPGSPTTTDALEEIDEILFDLLGFDEEERRIVRGALPGISMPSTQQTAPPTTLEDRSESPLSLAAIAQQFTNLLLSPKVGNYEVPLLRIRDALREVIRQHAAEQSARITRSLLGFAVLAVQHLSRRQPTDAQLRMLQELVLACRTHPSDPALIAQFERQLRSVGLDVLPSLPRAGERMTAPASEGGDEDDVERTYDV